jgi:hypothetical protein
VTRTLFHLVRFEAKHIVVVGASNLLQTSREEQKRTARFAIGFERKIDKKRAIYIHLV